MADDLLEVKLERLKYLKELREKLLLSDEKEHGTYREPWEKTRRPEQEAPPGEWFVWLILAGRGWGKTRTAVEWALGKVRKYPGCRIAFVASTIADARDTLIEGESGVLNCVKREELRGGTEETAWNRSLVEVFFANGSYIKGYSSEKPRKLRGPQFHFAVADEAAFWSDAFKGTISDTTWSNLAIATRLPRRYNWPSDYKAQLVMATTPRPVALLTSSDPDPLRSGLLQRDTTIVTRGRTTDNLDNLSDTYRANVIAPLLGTRLGRQELDGEILEDRADALWKRDWIDSNRIAPSAVPQDLVRVVVAVDPAVSDGETAAETGIIVAGAGRNGKGYVLGDYTLRGSPKECMAEAIRAYNVHQADRIVAEINNGGDYIGNLIRMIDPDVPFRPVRATRGKKTRAEPVSALYEQGRVAHAGQFSLLEDQLCTWSPMDEVSPDRLDACLISGTSVLTQRGNIPIEDVIPGEQVWTRWGWKPVTATRCTRRNAAVVTAELSDGQKITGTPDHKVWTQRGWTRLDSLVSGDTLSAWKSLPPKSSIKASSIKEIPIVKIDPIGSTIQRHAGAERDIFTGKSGEMQMSRRFPGDSISIMQTTIPSTMIPLTLSASHQPNILKLTRNTGNCGDSILTISDRSLRNGIGPRRDISGTLSMVSKHGRTGNLLTNVNASNAGKFLMPSLSVLDIAQKDASREQTKTNTTFRLSAPSAEQNFSRISTVPNPKPVRVSVVRSYAEEDVADVYDITVEDAHEFIASGVIVHNCVWAFTDLKDIVQISWTQAYNVWKCQRCKNPFFKKANGVQRTACPHCGEKMPDPDAEPEDDDSSDE